MMENLKITHIDWKAIEDKYVNRPLTEAEVSDLLRISLEALHHFLIDGRIHHLCTPPGGYFSLEEVKSFATKVLGIKDGSYIHDTEQQEDDKEKLAKRFELRKRLFKVMHPEKSNWRTVDEDINWSRFESFFDWIYDSPTIEWEGKIFCLAEIYHSARSIRCVIGDAEDLYNKLK